MKLLILSLFYSLSYVSAETTMPPTPHSRCAIELFSKVYRLDRNQSLSTGDVIHKTNCDSLSLSKISQIISNSNGTIGSDFLKHELQKDFPDTLFDISPRKISLLELNSVLRDQLTSETNFYFFNSKSLNNMKTLGLIEGEQLQASCESCRSTGEKNIKIEITNPIQNQPRALWFSSTIMAKVKAIKAKRNLGFQEKNLDANDFYIEEVFTNNSDNILTSTNNIQFFKPNKSIIQGAIILNIDLQAVNLITFGTPVSVILKNKSISLQRTALPTRSALFGEVIELKNPNNNKIIAGKVVDYNKVVIEL